jgi:hypothetical protein
MLKARAPPPRLLRFLHLFHLFPILLALPTLPVNVYYPCFDACVFQSCLALIAVHQLLHEDICHIEAGWDVSRSLHSDRNDEVPG